MRNSKVALFLLPAAAAVAGALLLLRLRVEPPTIPAYALAGKAEREVLHAGQRFELEARPLGAVVGAVGARAFLLRGAIVRPWDPPFDVARDGTVRIAGPVSKLFTGVERGDWEVAIAVGRPETLPSAPRDIVRARALEGGGAETGERHDAGETGAAWRLMVEAIRLDD